ncbi:MAG: phosphatase PAP2 family protein [Bacteroidetes bacterium]|nr:phosphatase PAP2 family protein [Bacteroidota bacterium]MCW5896995.1 phosphatase PAP2 family protein [Bacteroidota bacterium]
MIDWLYSIDVAAFHFFNGTLATSVGDVFWPYLTDYDKKWPIRILLIGVWLWLLIKGGKRGRTAALILIPLLFISDQFSSTFIKSLVGRVRPCHAFSAGEIHLLVGCGGLSFPSSHAVNNFGVATMFSWYYPKARTGLYIFASLVAISRVFVGVHYPSDVLGGAVIGTGVALFVVGGWQAVSEKLLPSIAVERGKQ